MKTVKINELVFKKIMDVVKSNVARDRARPVLQYALLRVAGKSLTAYAIDGFRGVKVKVELLDNNEQFDCLIMPINFKQSKEGLLDITVSMDDKCTFVEIPTEYGSLRYSFRNPGQYIDVDNVFDKYTDYDQKVMINPSYLVSAVKTAAQAGYDRIVTVHSKSTDPNQPLQITAKDEVLDIKQIVLPILHAGN